jgi:hypothetical protein
VIRVSGARRGLPDNGRRGRPGGGSWRRLLLLGAAALLAAALGAGLLSRSGSSSSASAGPTTAGVAPLAPLDDATSGRSIDGITAGTEEQLAFHIHAHLAVYVNGRPRAIPYGVGVLAPLQLQQTPDGPFVVGGAGFYWLHTHDTSGVIHIESPIQRRYTLGEFFDVWGQPLGPNQVGPVRGPVTILVDGAVRGGDPRDIPLDAHSMIQLDVGTVVPFRPYTFPSGL